MSRSWRSADAPHPAVRPRRPARPGRRSDGLRVGQGRDPLAKAAAKQKAKIAKVYLDLARYLEGRDLKSQALEALEKARALDPEADDLAKLTAAVEALAGDGTVDGSTEARIAKAQQGRREGVRQARRRLRQGGRRPALRRLPRRGHRTRVHLEAPREAR